MKKQILTCFMVLVILMITACGRNDGNYEYEIEYVIPDETFVRMIKGEIVPNRIEVGVGGENGYERFYSEDPEMIEEYISAFRNVKIAKEITDKKKMIVVCDGIIDYHFYVEDGTRVDFSTYINEYVTDDSRGIQFQLDNVDQLVELNNKIWDFPVE